MRTTSYNDSVANTERAILAQIEFLRRSGDILGAARAALPLARRRKRSGATVKVLGRIASQLHEYAKEVVKHRNLVEARRVSEIAKNLTVGLLGWTNLSQTIDSLIKRATETPTRDSDKVRVKQKSRGAAKMPRTPREKHISQSANKELKFGGRVASEYLEVEKSTKKFRLPSVAERIEYESIDRIIESKRSAEGLVQREQAYSNEVNIRGGRANIAAARDTVVERTPHMDFSNDEPLVPGTSLRVLVYANEDQARGNEESESIKVIAPAGAVKFRIDVKLIVSSHFVIPADRGRKRRNQQLVISRNKPLTNTVEFNLQILPESQLARTQPSIGAFFRYGGRPSGKVVRKVTIKGLYIKEVPNDLPQMRSTSARGSLSKTREEPSMEPPPIESVSIEPPRIEPPPTLALQYGADAADLTISVIQSEEKDGRHFKMIVDAIPLDERWEGNWILPKKTEEIVNGAMATFTAPSSSPVKRIASLKAAGIEMFRSTPQNLQDIFWRMVDAKKLPRHVLVISEEPYIPWELMVPQRRNAGGFETRDALGVEFAIGRWITDKYVSPPQKIALQQTFVVAPQYPPGRQLKHSANETKMVVESFGPASTISPALVQNIDSTLAQGGTTLLHFVCHGKAGYPQAISLEQDREQLTCWDIKALQGFLNSFPKSRTFVFLNACEVGRAAPALVGIGGFGNSFVEIGASAVIAPLWSVDDGIAFQVATKFYTELRTTPVTPFAEILRKIRMNAYSGAAQDTWAAYCFYGDPMARLA